MDHADHVALIRPGVASSDSVGRPDERRSVWADIGAGSGAFTLALAEILGPGAEIVALDRDAGALESAVAAVTRRFPGTDIRPLVADLTDDLDLPPLDGLIAANSLHFVRPERQVDAIAGLARCLRPDGRFIVVEYDTDHGNRWVPHPFSAATWDRLATAAGLTGATVIGRVPSRFLGAIYASMSRRPSSTVRRSASDDPR